MEIFIHHKASPYVRKVLLAVAELDVQADVQTINFSSKEAMDSYALVNPNRRFPAIKDGDLVLWESNAILRYLARQQPQWLGATEHAAATVDQWLCWELAHLGPPVLGLQNHRLGFGPRPTREESAMVADADRMIAVLDQSLDGKQHLVHDITIADLAVASMFSFAEEADLLPARFDNVRRWLDGIRARASWQATERMKEATLAAYKITLPRSKSQTV